MSQSTITVAQALNLAAEQMQSGEFEKSTAICNEILRLDEKNADALHLLALMSANLGKAQEAVDLMQRAILLRPQDFELYNNLGNILRAAGDVENAQLCYQQAAQLNPKCFAALYNLGNTFQVLGNPAHAINAFNAAIQLEPDFPDIHYSLGVALKTAGDNQGAIDELKKAIALNPDFMEAQIALGNVLSSCGHLDEGVAVYRKAAAAQPKVASLYNNLAVALTSLGRYEEARKELQQALELDASVAGVHNNLAVVERAFGNPARAQELLHTAIQLNPHYAEAYRNLGQILADAGQMKEAIQAYEKSLELKPDYVDALLELAICHSATADGQQAAAAFAKAQTFIPDSVVPAWGTAMLALPRFYQNEEQIAQARKDFENALGDLEKRFETLENPLQVMDAVNAIDILQPFYLTYQGKNNRDLQERFGGLVNRIMRTAYRQAAKPKASPLKEGERIKVGIVSHHFSNHSDWRVLIGGIMEGLDAKKFSIYAYSTGGISDSVTQKARSSAKSFVQGLGFEPLCQRIWQDGLHVLLFPELGMDPMTYKIASMRLAPLQCAGWARPETSGLPTIDYFLSSALMEPANAEEHYSEKLVRLPNLFAYYEPLPVDPDSSTLPAKGLVKVDTVRYVCVQSLFKYLPQHDRLLVEIAKRVKNAEFIFVSKPAEIAVPVTERIKACFRAQGLDPERHITLLPMLSHKEFAGLLKTADVFLDSIAYSGCLTTLDALEQDLPVVTMRGELMRGRQSAAMLDLIELKDLVAEGEPEFVEIAVRLGLDPALRLEAARRVADKRYWLYRDCETISALGDWLIQMVPTTQKEAE